MKNEIKAIIFDIGGVLQLGTYIKSKKMHHNLGVHEYLSKKFKKDLDSWFDSIDSTYADAIEGKISRKKTISILSQNLNVSPRKLIKLFHKAYKKGFKKNKKLYRIAFKLKKNYKIGILSDQWYLSKDVLVSKKDYKKFDVVIISCDVGIRKPNPKIYKLLIKKIRLKPKEILFIDNRKWNLIPAKKLGIKTILFKNNEQLIKDFKKLGI